MKVRLPRRCQNANTDSNIIPVLKETTRCDVCDPAPATASSVTTTLCPTIAASCVVTTASASATTCQDAIDLAILKQLEKIYETCYVMINVL